MSNILFATRAQGQLISSNSSDQCNLWAIDVSSYGPSPYNLFSPLTYSPEISIPIPGMYERNSCSVEGIWQGLKIIDSKIDEKMFTRKAKKRSGEITGHMYKDRVLGLEEARHYIYVPSYKYYLDNFAPQTAIDSIIKKQRDGCKIYVYDVEDNGDIREPQPLAHSAILATYLNLKIFNQVLVPQNDAEVTLYSILDDKISMEDKISKIEERLVLDGRQFKNAFKYRCMEHPTNLDDFNIGQVLGGIVQ